jgi:hypothetical protein
MADRLGTLASRPSSLYDLECRLSRHAKQE